MLHVAAYDASAFAYRDTGTFLWLTGPDGILRLEVRRGPATAAGAEAAAPMLSWQGQGWTAILAGPGDDTLNAWGQQWRLPPPGVAAVVQRAGAALVVGPPPPSESAGVWRAGRGGAKLAKSRIPSLREPAPGESPSAGFHGALVQRGSGRGGDDEMLALRWHETGPGQTPALEVRATRRPGRLTLRLLGSRAVSFAYPEAFVPLWPLSDLIAETP
jgi:hypothetical protein